MLGRLLLLMGGLLYRQTENRMPVWHLLAIAGVIKIEKTDQTALMYRWLQGFTASI